MCVEETKRRGEGSSRVQEQCPSTVWSPLHSSLTSKNLLSTTFTHTRDVSAYPGLLPVAPAEDLSVLLGGEPEGHWSCPLTPHPSYPASPQIDSTALLIRSLVAVGERVCVCVCVCGQEAVSAGGCTSISFHLQLPAHSSWHDCLSQPDFCSTSSPTSLCITYSKLHESLLPILPLLPTFSRYHFILV